MTKLLVLLLFTAASCSPYKKSVLTMGEQMTKRFKGATEKEVLDAMGSGHTRAEQAIGTANPFWFRKTVSLRPHNTAIPVTMPAG